VKDTGPGIPPADRLHIFDRFYRVDKGRSRREGGSGLGLAIVRELTEVMGGDVRVESTEGDGARFTISLPGVPAPTDGDY
jgi:signal transduction histidine kinase